MADICDVAGEQADYLLQVALDRHHQRAAGGTATSAEFCDDCGEAIPPLRREKVLGCQRCVECQSVKERSDERD